MAQSKEPLTVLCADGRRPLISYRPTMCLTTLHPVCRGTFRPVSHDGLQRPQIGKYRAGSSSVIAKKDQGIVAFRVRYLPAAWRG